MTGEVTAVGGRDGHEPNRGAMTAELFALTFRANDPAALAGFWAGVLGRERVDDAVGGITLPPGDDPGFRLRFVPEPAEKAVQNRMHLDLTSTSLEDQRRTVERALALGGRHIDIGQSPDDSHVVLADPEGNEFCVIEPGNSFLADCGVIGALACDGTQQVGYFWSEALGWPLVWDQDQETAIRSPRGGTKITWGGPPLMPRDRLERLHFDLVLTAGSDQQAEIERLVSLGATRVDAGRGEGNGTSVTMADPDDNVFCVITSLR